MDENDSEWQDLSWVEYKLDQSCMVAALVNKEKKQHKDGLLVYMKFRRRSVYYATHFSLCNVMQCNVLTQCFWLAIS